MLDFETTLFGTFNMYVQNRNCQHVYTITLCQHVYTVQALSTCIEEIITKIHIYQKNSSTVCV